VNLESYIRDVPDFPKPGIMFKDITPLLAAPEGFRACIDTIADAYRDAGVTKVLGAEARGFILGGALAYALGAGFIPARKPGKLPAETTSAEYQLEYGVDTLEMHTGADKTITGLANDTPPVSGRPCPPAAQAAPPCRWPRGGHPPRERAPAAGSC
jgi:adenine phosphoribosyltransferase